MSRTQLLLVTSTGVTFISATSYAPCRWLSDDEWPRPHYHQRRAPLLPHTLHTNSMSHLNVTNPLSKNSTLNHKWTSLSLRNAYEMCFFPFPSQLLLCAVPTNLMHHLGRTIGGEVLWFKYLARNLCHWNSANSITRKRVVFPNLGRTIQGKVLSCQSPLILQQISARTLCHLNSRTQSSW